MARGQRIRYVRNRAGHIVPVRPNHKIMRDPEVEVMPPDFNPNAPRPYEEWAAEDLMALAEERGIDVGQARKPETLARKIREAEEEPAKDE